MMRGCKRSEKMPLLFRQYQPSTFIPLYSLMALVLFLGSTALAQPSLDIAKVLVDPAGGPAQVGDTIVFDLILENTGTTTITSLPLTDAYDPDCLRFLSADPAENTDVPGFVYWSNLGPLSPGASDTVRILFYALYPCGMTLDTASTCDAQDQFGDPVPGDEGIAGVIIVESELEVEKILIDPPGGTADVGDTVVFQVLVENTGTTDIGNVPLLDTFDPACLTFLWASPAPNQAFSGLLLWCCLGPVAAGQTDTVMLYFSADYPCGVTIDTALTSGVVDEYGFDVPDDEDIAAVNIVALDLNLTKSIVFPSGGKVELGDTAVFEIVLENTGTSDIMTLPLHDHYEADCLEFAWADPAPDAIINGELTWLNVGPLLSGTSDTVVVAFRADSLCGATIDTALATGVEDEFGSMLPDLMDTASVEILQGLLSLTKIRIDPDSLYAAVGDTVTFGVMVENVGTAIIDSLPVTDSYNPACLTFLSADPAEDSHAAGLLSWYSIGPLGVGDRDTVLLYFQAIDSCGITGDTARVSGAVDEAGTTLPDVEDTASVFLVELDLTVSKSRWTPAGSASYGDTVTFLIILINDGSSTITTLPLSDLYDPACLEFLWADPVQNSLGDGWITWDNRGPLSGGFTEDSIWVHFRAIGPCGVTNDTALISGAEDEFGLLLPGEEDTATVNLVMPLLEVYKLDELDGDSDGNGVPSPGDTLLYTVTLTNTGNDSATGVAFVDTPGVHTTLVVGSVTTTSGVVTSGNTPGDDTVGVDIGTIDASASDVITFQVIIDNPVPAGTSQVSDQGFALSSELPDEPTDDPDTSLEDDSTYTQLTTEPQLEVTKGDTIVGDISPLDYANPGDTLQYEVIFINNGNIGVSGVAYIDTPGVNTTLIVGSVTTTQGAVLVGNTPGDDLVWVSIGIIPGGGSSDTVTFQVCIDAPLPYGTTQVENQGLASSNELVTEPSDDPATGSNDDATITTLVMPAFEITKVDSFYTDVDGNSTISPLDIMYYEITVENLDSVAALNVSVVDTPGAYISLVPGSVTTTRGSVVLGNFAWDWYLRVDADTLAPDSTMVITFLAMVDCLCPLPFGGVDLENQAWLSSSQLSGQPSDDPATPTPDDPTLTPMDGYELYIGGQISYYSNGEPVPDVVVSISGDGTGSAVTDENGDFRLSSLLIPELCACNDYIVTPDKVNNACDAITDHDKSLVQRYVTGLDTLSALQLIAADVSGNGTVSMWDAVLIGQRSIGLTHTFPAGDWVFIPSEIVYTDLDSVETDADFIGILLGDVSGNWEPCVEIPEVLVSPLALEMTLTEGQVGFDSVFVCNTGPGVLSYTVSEASPVSWLSESPTLGAVIAYSCDTMIVTFNATTLSTGDYYATILVDSSDPDAPQVAVSVHLEVEPGIPDITVIPTSITKILTEGESILDTFSICNDGNGVLTFNMSDGVSWLGEQPTNGTVGSSLCQEIIVTCNATALSAGNYFASIVITSNDPDEPVVSVSVNLQVLEILSPDILVSPPSFDQMLPEGDITIDDLFISNDGNATLTYNISESGGDIPWLSVFPTSGSVSASDDAIITIGFDASSITAGDYYGDLELSSNDPDEPLVTVPVHLNVYTVGPCSPLGDVDGNAAINVLDVVLLANIILEVHSPTSEELCRADCNQDSEANVLDLVAIVNVILGTGTCPPVMGAKVVQPEVALEIPADTEIVGGSGVLPISLSNDVDLKGLQFTIRYNPSEIKIERVQPVSRTKGFSVAFNDVGEHVTVLIYSPEGNALLPGHGPIARVVFTAAEMREGARSIQLGFDEAILAVNCTQAVYVDARIVTVEMSSYKPQHFSLSQNYPNPFNPVTSISYTIPVAAQVKVDVYDLLGRSIDVLVDAHHEAGYYTVPWDASNVASGVYFYRLTADEFVQTRRMVLMK